MFRRDKHGTVDVICSDEALVGERLEELERLLQACLDQGQPHVVLDLHGSPIIDSAGLELLVDTQQGYQRCGGTLKLAAPNLLCKEILDVSGVAEYFEIHKDVKQAVGSFLR